ncbi:MAG: Nramp family divalent metal transporter [Prolixibacteraceae bacterium]|jgi:manganese transport protein|nr:Nramp family divalent metal transporter [Prolixibacteraceae bacterium]MBT6766114.1 Nramp family divalent metal transporter [Prolixibacteraceae bacterium]MBT7000794.1 Nramp family divalent metal transporter [Prolixibacteraceae bacterium]MBT7393569.1 Nramp family divalent metal transporter [Prolixibacteraceae bacterium]
MKKFKIFLASIAPGFFLIGYNIGTGSITTMASSGASFGMELIWPLLLSCIFTYFLIVTFGRYTAITGNTILFSFRKFFGKPVTIFVLISLLISEWVSCMGVMGIVTQIIQEWSKPFFADSSGINPVISALVFGALLYYLFWQGKHNFFEKILVIFVTVMGISFIATMFIVIPDPKEMINGLIPRIPKNTEKLLLAASMVGTTMGAILYVVRSILVQEKGWKSSDLKLEKRDALISAGMMFVLSMAIMATAAGTLYPAGLKVDNAIDMVKLMEPIAGRFAISVFVAGIVSAGLSSLFPIIILAPWLFADYNNKPRDMKSTQSRLLVLIGVILGFAVPIFGGRPVFVMIISQSLAIIVTPLVLLLMLVIITRLAKTNNYPVTKWSNIFFGLIIIFTLIMAIAGISGIIGSF